ncbi:hypothetical protein QE152_g20745 [Popillia japonica]|uniref:Uncharacterized protein n=1 Tax=Popillia japonica TaxID=7064 RepID=A0AAW1KQB4_POPJA
MYINNKQDYDIRKLGVWNIRSLTGKEDEMVYEFNKTALDILVIPETKKKETGEIDITDGHRLLYSGVPQMNRAAGGIACLVHRRLLQSIITWKGWSERILTVEFLIGGEILRIIAVYGPNENEKKESITGQEEKRATMQKVERCVNEVCDGEKAGLEHRESTGKRQETLGQVCIPVKVLGTFEYTQLIDLKLLGSRILHISNKI